MKSKLAQARDAWLSSQEGSQCQDGSASSEYLTNRLELAFLAGYHAAEKAIAEEAYIAIREIIGRAAQ